MLNVDEAYQNWPWHIRYTLAFSLMLLALVIRFETLPSPGTHTWVTFYPAVITAFYLCGTKAGVIVAILSGLIGHYYFVPPFYAFAADLKTYTSLAYFYLTCFLIGYSITRLHNYSEARQQAEKQLQRAIMATETAKNRLEHLLKNSPAIMYSCRSSGDFGANFISDNVTNQLGFQPDDFINDSSFWLTHIHPDDQPAILENLKVMLTGDLHRYEYRFLGKNGDFHRMQDEFAVLRDSDGHPLELIGYWVDVTDRWEIEKISRLRQFSLDHTNEQVYWLDIDARVIDVNQTAYQKLGYTREELLRCKVMDVDPSFPADKWAAHWQQLKENGSLRFESTHQTKAGKTYPVEISVNYFEYDHMGYACAVVRDITERKQLENTLKFQAQTDFLTGVSSRGYFMEQAELELNRALRYSNPVSVLMMDIDFFKQINDTYGHRAGDNVLKELAEACRQTLREVDIIGRIGGEEFAILLPETETEVAAKVAERLREVLAMAKVPLEAGGQAIHFTVSIGLTSLSNPQDNIETLLNLADRALYQAKNSGRNKVCLTGDC